MSKLNEMSIRRNNVIVFDNKYDTHVPNGKEMQKVWSFIKSLNDMGYTLDSESAKELLGLPALPALLFMKDTLQSIVELTGNKNFEVFYKNFPAQTLNLEPEDLYFNSFLHYVFGFLPEDDEERKEFTRQLDPDFFTTKKFKVLSIVQSSYYVELLKTIVSSKVATSSSDGDDIVLLIKSLTDKQVSEALQTEIPFKEVLALVMGQLYLEKRLHNIDTTMAIKTATDLLRVIAFNNSEATVIEDHMKLSLKNSDRRFILNSLETMKNPVEDLLRNKLIWRDIAKLVHVKKSTHPKTKGYFDYLFDKKKFITFNSTVEPLMLKYKETLDTKVLVELLNKLSERPSELGRRLDALVRYSETNKELNNHFNMIVKTFDTVASEMNSRVLYQIRNHFINRTSTDVPRIVEVNGLTTVLANEGSLSQEKVDRVIKTVDSALEAQYVFLEPLGKVYIADDLKNYALTTSERTSSKSNMNPLTTGTRIPLNVADVNTTLRTFVFWKNIPAKNAKLDEDAYAEYLRDVDIDSSAVFLNDKFEELTLCTYYNINASIESKSSKVNHTIAIHSGDIVTAPKGAAEYVDIDLKKAKELGVRYVTFNVNSYSNQTLKDIGTVTAGYMLLDSRDNMKGEIYNQNYIESSNSINSDSTDSLVLTLDLETMEMIWIDTPTSKVMTLNNVTSTLESFIPVVKKNVIQKFTSLKDLYTIHAKARGSEIVDNKEDADIVFDIPNLETPLDIADITANWV